jgi:hypothetical protein
MLARSVGQRYKAQCVPGHVWQRGGGGARTRPRGNRVPRHGGQDQRECIGICMPRRKSYECELASRGTCTATHLLANEHVLTLHACAIGVSSPPCPSLPPTHCLILVPDQPRSASSTCTLMPKPQPQPLPLLPSPAVPRDRLLGGAAQADQHGARGCVRVRAARQQSLIQGPILQAPRWVRTPPDSPAHLWACTPLTPWHPTPCALRCEADQVRAVASIHRGRRQVCA